MRLHREHNYIYLLAGLLVLIISGPLVKIVLGEELIQQLVNSCFVCGDLRSHGTKVSRAPSAQNQVLSISTKCRCLGRGGRRLGSRTL